MAPEGYPFGRIFFWQGELKRKTEGGLAELDECW